MTAAATLLYSKSPSPVHRAPRLKRRAAKARRYLSLVPVYCFRRGTETTKRIAIMTKILPGMYIQHVWSLLNKQIFIIPMRTMSGKDMHIAAFTL